MIAVQEKVTDTLTEFVIVNTLFYFKTVVGEFDFDILVEQNPEYTLRTNHKKIKELDNNPRLKEYMDAMEYSMDQHYATIKIKLRSKDLQKPFAIRDTRRFVKSHLKNVAAHYTEDASVLQFFDDYGIDSTAFESSIQLKIETEPCHNFDFVTVEFDITAMNKEQFTDILDIIHKCKLRIVDSDCYFGCDHAQVVSNVKETIKRYAENYKSRS